MTPSVRQAVVAEALSWLGTPYAHRQRLKGVGVDCAQLPLAVYAAAGVIGEADVGAYAAQWHLHRGEELYLRHLQALGGREIARGEALAGDFAIWRYGRTFSHGAILVGQGAQVVHACRGLGVLLGDIGADEDLRTRPMRLFTLDRVGLTDPSASCHIDFSAIRPHQTGVSASGAVQDVADDLASRHGAVRHLHCGGVGQVGR